MKRSTIRQIVRLISTTVFIILLCSPAIKERPLSAEKIQFLPSAVNPLDYATQKDEPITAQDIVSFILRWVYPETGLVPTEIAKTGTKNPNRYLCSTYVSAVAHQILFMSGRTEESAKMAETIRSLAAKGNLSNTLDVRTGLSADFVTTAGPNTYWGISFIREYQLTNDAKWLKAAKGRGDFLLSLQDTDGGIRKDPYIGCAEYYTKSTEENLDCYALFNLLFEITKDKKYEIARNKILKWLVTSGVYHKEEGYFSIATVKDKVDPTYGLDANVLAIIILGPEILNATEGDYIFRGSETAQRVVKSFERARVTVNYTHPNQEVIKDVNGFDFTDERGRPGRDKILSPEFSSQAALAYLVMVKDAKERGDLVSANKFLEMTKDILENLAKISARVDGAVSLPYATSAGIRRFAFDNWYTPRPEANISGAWVAFPLAGFNPFARDGFELRDSLKDIAPWMTAIGEITPFPKAFPERTPEKFISEVELVAEKEAIREEIWEKPVIYYKYRYETTKEGVQLARRRLEANLMTGYSCWINSLIDPTHRDYDVIGVTKDGLTLKRKFAELPKKLTMILKEEYLYYDEETGIDWRLAPKYNLNVDYSRGTYYAFEVDENYQIVRQFKSEVDVPKPNRADLRGIKSKFQSIMHLPEDSKIMKYFLTFANIKGIKSQYKSTAGLPEGHKIMRYFLALEVDEDCKIVKAYESIYNLPALVSKVPINQETYKRYIEADDDKRKSLIAAGIIPDKKGKLAVIEYGEYYYTQVLALDTSRRLFTKTYSKESGSEIISGTRMLLADWEVDEKTKINAIKYEQGLIDGMAMKAPRPTLGEKPLLTEPVWIYVGEEAVKQEEQELLRRQQELALQIEDEEDAQVRHELIMKFDRLRWGLTWYDEDGYLHVIVYGLKAAEKTLGDLEEVKKRAEASLREYISVLGLDEEGRDLRDSSGCVWLKVINKRTGRILHVEVYDLVGNLKFLLAGDIEIDPLFKTVTAKTRTDIKYDRTTGQMLGSHSYFIDENDDWVSDIHEGIFKGYTPDGKHFIIERRVFLKDKSGDIVFKDNKAQFTKKIEYYTPEGDIVAQIAGDTITAINYESGTEVVRRVYIDITNGKTREKNENLTDLIKDKVWTRRFQPTGKTLKFKDVLIENLTSLPEDRRVNAAVAILNRLGVEEIERTSDRLLLEESGVTTNLSERSAAEDTSKYYMFYESGDYLGRERIKIQGSIIRIPVAWIPRTQIAAKTLSFNLSGELVSINEIIPEVRADAIVPRVDLPKLTVLGIEADTLLPVAKEKVYRLVTEEDGSPHFSSTVDIIRMSYLIPDDMLGRELVTIKYSMVWNETRLHPGGTLKAKQNWLKQDVLMEVWLDDKGKQRQRVIGKRKETVVNEWYKQGLTLKELRAALIKELLEDAIEEGKLKLQNIPTTFKELEDALKEERIKAGYLPVKIEELKEAIDKLKVAPFGVLPGYHVIKADKTIGEIKYFAGLAEYPRSKFGHQGIDVPYEPQIKPFKLPEGPPLKGFKYGLLNSDNINYEVHTLSGQLIIRERPYIQVRLVNMFPIKGDGEQTEYYNPLVPYSYLEPIKIERYFKPGKQPEGEKPGVSIIGVFRKKATTYHENGWQTQVLMERRPLDVDHWIKSEILFDKDGILKYKKQHIESRVSAMKITGWRKSLIIFIGLFALGWLMSRINHKRMKIANEKIIKQAEERIKAGVSPEAGTLPFTREKLKGLEKQLTYFSSIISRELIDELKAECIRVYENNQPPVKLKELVDKIYKPLIEDHLRYLGTDPSNYTAGINNLLARIFMRLGREEINLKSLYAQEIKEFENWSSKLGHRFSWRDTGLFKEDCLVEEPDFFSKDNILIITLFRLVLDESIEFKATAPSFRYFLFDKSLNMLISGQKDMILQEIQSDTWTLLEALRPGYVKELQLTKESIFTYEDVEELFKGKKRRVLQTFSELTGQTKEQKLNYLASGETQITAKDIKNYKSYRWLKTYSDKQGFLQFIINLSRLWVPLIPLFIAIFAGGVLMGLKSLPLTSQVNAMSSFLAKILSPLIVISRFKITLFLHATIFLSIGILATAFLFKLTLGGFKSTNQAFEYQKTAKRATRQFWLLFVSAVYLWGIFSIFVTSWTTVVIFKSTFLNNGWELFIDGSAALLSLVFVMASFYSLFYIIISILAYFKGKREGIGQVIDWSQIKKNLKESKKRFMDVMVPCKFKNSLVSKEEIWKTFWNIMIGDLHKYHKLNDDEQKRLLYSQENTTPNFNKKPKNKEAQERIQKYINSWLMETPKVDFWTDLPTLTAMITAFNEPVSNSFDELNNADRGATETKLNYLISRYPTNWNEFVNRLSEKDLGRWITKDEIRRISGLKRLPENLPVHLEEKIKRWANIITQPLEKTIIEVSKIRDAFMMYARVCYPEAQDEDIEKMVDDKIQILLNYEGYHKQFSRDEDRVSLRKLMREFPHLEVYWDSVREDYVSGEGQDRFEFKKGTDGGLHRYNPMTKEIGLFQITPQTIPPKVGKPTGFSQAFPFIKGEKVLFFDANAAVRIEDAAKIPLALSEFNNDPKLAEVLFSEYIYTRDSSWVSQAVSFNDETFTSVTQRALNLFEACGFYGHSAIIKTDIISSSGGIPQDYVSEDILLSAAMWLKGFRTTHKEYLMFGKGREISFYAALVPFIKWAAGASEIALGRVTPELLQSKQLHYAQKIMLMFGFSFYYHIPFVLLINFLYLWLMVCWGVNAFMSIPFPFIFATLGLMFNQSITSMGMVYLIERYSFWKSLREYINLVGKNFFLYTAAIPTYALGFVKGIKGKIKLAISSKGWNLGHIPFKTIWGKERIHLNVILATTLIVIPILFVLVALEMVPFWISPFIAFAPLLTVIIIYTIGVVGSRLGLKFLGPLRDEIVPEGDFTKVSAIKIQIIFSIGLIAFLGVGFIMWGILFSSLASKILFLLSILYICPPLSYVLIPILAHSQPLSIFKEITTSKLWNYFLMPLISVFCLIGVSLMSLRIIEIKIEVIMYLSFGIAFLIGWVLLKRRLSGYDFLDKWMKKNVPFYKKSSITLKSDLQDDIYFSHQELMRFEKDKRMTRLLQISLILLAVTTPIIFILYVLTEFERGFYSPWLWLIIVVEIISCLLLNIVSTAKERDYLKNLIDKINEKDLYKLNEDIEFIDNIWQGLSLRYKNVLIEVYDDEKRAKEVLGNYLSSWITKLGYDSSTPIP